MKKVIVVLSLLLAGPAFSEGLQWQIPGGIGTVQLPVNPEDILPVVGYDAVQKEVIAGGTASLITLFKEINGYAGAVGAFQKDSPYIQPYLAIGSDFARYVPALRQVQNFEIHAFVRYVPSGVGDKHYGAGGAVAYRFGAPTPIPPQAPSQPPAPPATLPTPSGK
jgi:hypothetical protein